MKPRNNVFSRIQNIDYTNVDVWYDSSTSPWTRKETVTAWSRFPMQPQDVDVLKCGPTVKGDKRSPNAFWFTKVFQSNLSGVYTQLKLTNGVNLSGGFTKYVYSGPIGSGVQPLLQPPSSDSYNKALGKLNERLRSDVDLSVDIAQAGQVRSMVANTARLASYTRGFNRKTLANKWLEFVYGWKPLAQSLYGSIEQVYSMANASKRITAKATAVEKSSSTVNEDIWRKTQKETSKSRTLFSFDYTASSPKTDQLARLSSLNPVSIAWELVPYSFVVDWMYDIGGFLHATESYLVASTGTLTNGYVTTTSIQTATAEWAGLGKVPGGWETTGVVSGTTVLKQFSRQLLPFWPLPRAPVLKLKLGTSRLFSAAALLAQFLPDGQRPRMPKRTITTERWDKAVNRLNSARRSRGKRFL